MSNLTFGEALVQAKEGKLIARNGWNGKGMFVFLRPPFECDTKQPYGFFGLLSIPDAVKDWYKNNHTDDSVKFTDYLCIKAADNTIVNGWLASQTDILANDWVVI